jgi:phosphatidylglycerol---prolipoprotein diacylglyceryl transferase
MDVLLAAFTYTPQQRWFDTVSPHGVGTALGFFLGAWLMAKRAEPRGIPRSEVYNAVTWGAIGAIVGARGFYVIGHLSSYRSIVDALKVWEGGLTMFGGFIGGLVLGLGYLWRKKFDVPTAMDAAAPGFVVGVLIGRIGDIIIADHLGQRTSAAFGYRIPNAPLAPGYGPPYYTPGVVVHHTAVYDFLGALVLFAFLRWYEKKRQPRVGSVFAAFSIWYGLQRFLIDFTRNRAIIESSYFGLSGSQWAGLGFAVFGIFLLIRLRNRVSPAPDAAVVPALISAAIPHPVESASGQSPVPADAPPAWTTPPAPVPPPPSTGAQPPPAPAEMPPEPAPQSVPPPPVPPPPAPVEGTSPDAPAPAEPAPPPSPAPVPAPEPGAYESSAPPSPAPPSSDQRDDDPSSRSSPGATDADGSEDDGPPPAPPATS